MGVALTISTDVNSEAHCFADAWYLFHELVYLDSYAELHRQQP